MLCSSKLHIEVKGKGNPLILLHGWGWHSGIWQPLVPLLSEKYQLFLIDLPGFGKNASIIKPYTIEELGEAIISIGLPKQAYWLGWSLGGMIAWYIAIHFPEYVSRLVTVAASPKFVMSEHWPGVTLPTVEKFERSIAENQHQTLVDFLQLQLRGSANIPLFDQLKAQFIQQSFTSVEALLFNLKLLCQIDLRAELSKLLCPSLHLFGNLDVLVPVNIIELIQSHLPLAQYEVINRCGHIPFLTHQEIFLNSLNQFFS